MSHFNKNRLQISTAHQSSSLRPLIPGVAGCYSGSTRHTHNLSDYDNHSCQGLQKARKHQINNLATKDHHMSCPIGMDYNSCAWITIDERTEDIVLQGATLSIDPKHVFNPMGITFRLRLLSTYAVLTDDISTSNKVSTIKPRHSVRQLHRNNWIMSIS